MQPSQDIRLSGACVITNIVSVRQMLLDAFAFGGSIAIDLSDIEHVDVSFVQLIVAAACTANQTATTLTLSQVPDAVAKSFKSAGVDVAALSGNGPH